MSQPIVVTVVFTPVEGAYDRVVNALSRGIEEIHGEAGCELYAIHSSPDGTIVMLEKWTSVEDLDAHAAGEPVARMDASLVGLLQVPPLVTRVTPIPAGTHDQGTL